MSDEASQQPIPANSTADTIKAELQKTRPSWARGAAEKFLIAALGSIPWIGGFIAAAAELRGERAAEKADDLRTQWLTEHQRKLDQLAQTLQEILSPVNICDALLARS